MKTKFNINIIKKINFRNLKKKPLLVKILFTLIMITIFRIAATITIPGVNIKSEFTKNADSFLGILNLMGGGGLSSLSIVALGISPFITASIIMQLFQSEAFPPLHRLSKSGPKGKRKINVITRILTFMFAIMQAIVMINQFSTAGAFSLKAVYDFNLYKYFVLPVILVGGSMFSLFLGEQITNRGVGNGTSLIIFSGIAATLPTKFQEAYKILSHTYDPQIFSLLGENIRVSRIAAIINFLTYFVFFWVLIYIIAYIYNAERHIPIQQTGAGMTTDAKQMSRLPIKLNPAGVMPIIFPMMLLSIPGQIVQFFDDDNKGKIWVLENLRLTKPIGMLILVSFIFLFSIGMSLVTISPTQIADNFKKQGTFIPGIRPGNETEEYLSKILIRLAFISGFYLSAITLVKYIQEIILTNATGFPSSSVSQISFGGTSLLILVSVAIETTHQLKARGTSHKISMAKINSKTTKGFLW